MTIIRLSKSVAARAYVYTAGEDDGLVVCLRTGEVCRDRVQGDDRGAKADAGECLLCGVLLERAGMTEG